MMLYLNIEIKWLCNDALGWYMLIHTAHNADNLSSHFSNS